MPQQRAPKSFFDTASGMFYFPRMINKIRLYAAGELREDCHANLGIPQSADGACCGFLQVSYDELKHHVLEEGGSDEEILQWCFQKGRTLTALDIMIWNEFLRKRGWNDVASQRLAQWKEESGHTHRDDLNTIPEYTEVLEGRKD